MPIRLALSVLLMLTTAAMAQNAGPVSVSGGQVQGRALPTGGAVFKGIPFAQPPVGALRWREPQAVKAWRGIRQAADYGAPCAQSDAGWNKQAAALSSEDCLYLNVWTPEWPSKSNKAVMLWIHGGGNGGGSALGAGGIEPPFDGVSLARQGVVVVTINYRLGLFGFIGHPELTAESQHHASGAYGLLDQIAAMQWVQKNIGHFGGDAGNVTVFGQSAGAQNLSILMASPLTRGLFQKAILESGTPMISDKRLQTPAQTQHLGEILAQVLHAPARGAITYLRGLPTNAILGASQEFRKALDGLILDVGMDGYVVPAFSPTLYRQGKELAVPLIIGNNGRETGGGRGDGTRTAEELLALHIDSGYAKYPDLQQQLRTLYGVGGTPAQIPAPAAYGPALAQLATDEEFRCPAVMLADWHGVVASTYEYEFTAMADEHPPVHSGELSLVFGALPDWAVAAGFNDLSATMQKYWTNFAKTGDPNGTGLPHWPRHDATSRAYLELGNGGPTARAGLRASTCAIYAQKLNRDIDQRQLN